MKILLYNPDNGVTRNFMPHLWMFLLQSITPAGHEVILIDGNARAMDDDGAVTTSDAVSVTVAPPPNVPPQVTLTAPANNATHTVGTPITLRASATDADGTVARVEFLDGTTVLGDEVLTPDSSQPLVGASGAIAGVLGAYLVLFPRAKVWSLLTFFFFLPLRLPAWLVLGSWFVLQYLYLRGAGLAEGGVAYGAHVVGFVVGALLVLRLRGSGRQPEPRGRYSKR